MYGITPRGEELFSELLTTSETPADDDRDFNLRLVFARYLAPDARLALLHRRRAALAGP